MRASRSWGTALKEAVVTNWPVKATALVLAGVLWAAVAAEEPTTQLVPVSMVVQPPTGRTLKGAIPPVQAVYVGATRELIKLYSSPPTIQKVLPDTLSGNEYLLALGPEDLVTGRTINVRAEDVQPRTIRISLDDVAQRELRVSPRITIVPDSGYVLLGGIAVTPSSVTVRGPEATIRRLREIATVPTELTGITQPVRRTVPLDTTGLGRVRMLPDSVEIMADVAFLAERVLMGVPITIQADRAATLTTSPLAVLVTVRGPGVRLARLTRDSVTVVANPVTDDLPVRAALQVVAPEGITGVATPDSATVQRRGRG
ncbi:MAG: YbbR-like domain-containing protein [Gemmatimonadota bacterium]|nr:YbbR-like domain-containing protein [Gemmatimonadota bacterium]